ncbi:N-acetyltransferase [Kurthia gibsonii]|uniref:N-acetyltransferase n=1 Tax=Kurthia gibsonii TaxID=33946 RepID=A0ABU9LH20_9BACL
MEILNNQPNTVEIDMLMKKLISYFPYGNINKIKLECLKNLFNRFEFIKDHMNIIGERVMFTKNLIMEEVTPPPQYEVWPIHTNKSIVFLSEIMKISFNEAQNFLIQMREELPEQAEKMYTVYIVNHEPIGVVLPHIEPRTDKEGRIFWIGIHPRFLGTKLGKNLHTIGLYRLKNEFKANSYLGITKIDNHAMKKVMISNNCLQNENTLISLEYISEK